MIGILLLTHSFLGTAFIQAVEQLTGPQKNLKAIDIDGNFDHDTKWNLFMETLESLDQGEGVLVLADLFGSTPSNIAIAGLAVSKIEVVVGVNLPMLIHVLENRQRNTLEDLAEFAKQAGQKDIKIASTFLTENPLDTKELSQA